MAQFRKDLEGFSASRTVKIGAAESLENYTVYIIEVRIGPYSWTVRHRYSEFFELHEKLVTQYQLDKNLLPPKKLFGNQSESFIKKRQGELEIYLQTVLHHLSGTPSQLASFLHFHKYEIHGLTQALAEELYHKGDMILEAGEIFHVTPLQLHAISERLKLAEPTCEEGDKTKDLGHVLDFVTRLRYLKIIGSNQRVSSSNMVMNELVYDMLCFKNLQCLELQECNCETMTEVDHIKKTLNKLNIHKSIKAIKDIMLLGVGHGAWLGGEEEALIIPAWATLTSVDFSHNNLTSIDESVKMMPRVEFLDLSDNELEDVQHLQHLTELNSVDLSSNNIRILNSLHTKLGNIKSLCLAGNRLESLLGFSKLYSLESLDVSGNEISQVLEVRHISSLPCLENLVLTGNPVTIVVDYRTKILELFGGRATEVCLDGQKPSQKELDTVAILLAIQKSKETKERARKHAAKKPAVEAHITDSTPGAHGNSQGSDPSASVLAACCTSLISHHANSASSPSHPTLTPLSHGSVNTTTDAAAAVTTITTTKTFPHDPELFRMRVEAIREQGGAAWLTLLNAMTTRHGPGSPSREQRSPENAPRAHTERHRSKHHRSAHQKTTAEESSTDGESDSSSIVSTEATGFMLPETLPGKNDASFTTFLQGIIPNTSALSHQLRQAEEGRKREERAVHVMWCSALCYADPYKERPACVYVTTENLHIFFVTALRGSSGWPELTLAYSMPLHNIQQIVIGFEEVYLRLEEAFVGPQGTITFITYSPHKTRAFMDTLKTAIRRANSDREHQNEPHVVWNGESEMNLKAVLNRVECLPNVSDVPLILYLLVQTLDVASDKQNYCTHSLVITAKYLYIVREDYILWPQPTYGIGPATRPQFEVIHSYPIAGRISGIQMYDSDSLSTNTETLPENFLATGSSVTMMGNFIGFGVKLVFEMGQQQGSKELDVRVPTSGMRDKFLATLTQVRRDLSDRSPSPPKGKTHRGKVREAYVYEDNRSDSSSSRGSRSSIEQHPPPPHVSNSAQPVMPPPINDAPAEPTPPSPTTDQNDNEGKPREDDNNQVQALLKVTFNDTTDAETDEAVSSQEPTTSNSVETETLAPNHYLPPSKSPPHTPNSLAVLYPTMELLDHLTSCNEKLTLLQTLSDNMRNLAAMTGEELLNYFHSQVALIGGGAEELSHVLWTMVTPYLSSHQEIITCVLLSTKAVYFLSDDAPKRPKTQLPSWRTHNRNKSDSLLAFSRHDCGLHHSSGILLPGDSCSTGPSKQRVKAYFTLALKELRQVNIGMFDQSFRVAGDEGCKVYTCVTRDNVLTESFVKRLMTVLSSIIPSPSPEGTSSDSEPDVYKMFARSASRSESLEYIHPSRVKFVYPSEDAVSDVTYLMVENVKGKKPKPEDVKILFFLLLFQMDTPARDGAEKEMDFGKNKPRTLIVTNSHICLAIEDHVSYPLPEFVKGLPERPNFEVTEARRIEFLRRIVMNDFTSHDLTLVFADETEEIVVDLSREHYTTEGGGVMASTPAPEVRLTLVIQNMKDRDRLLKLLSRQWSEFHDEELSVQVSA